MQRMVACLKVKHSPSLRGCASLKAHGAPPAGCMLNACARTPVPAGPLLLHGPGLQHIGAPQQERQVRHGDTFCRLRCFLKRIRLHGHARTRSATLIKRVLARARTHAHGLLACNWGSCSRSLLVTHAPTRSATWTKAGLSSRSWSSPTHGMQPPSCRPRLCPLPQGGWPLEVMQVRRAQLAAQGCRAVQSMPPASRTKEQHTPMLHMLPLDTRANTAYAAAGHKNLGSCQLW